MSQGAACAPENWRASGVTPSPPPTHPDGLPEGFLEEGIAFAASAERVQVRLVHTAGAESRRITKYNINVYLLLQLRAQKCRVVRAVQWDPGPRSSMVLFNLCFHFEKEGGKLQQSRVYTFS